MIFLVAFILSAGLASASLWHRHVYGVVVDVSTSTINSIEFDTLLVNVMSAGLDYQYIKLNLHSGAVGLVNVGDTVLSIINLNILTSDPPEAFSIWATIVHRE